MNINPALANRADPDNIYVNVRINHDNSNTLTTRASYDVTKTIPVVQNPDEYYLAVVDFTIPLTSVPLSIAKVIHNDPAHPNNSNLMEALVVITNDAGVAFPVNLIYVPTSNAYPTPVQPNFGQFPNQQIITPYYYIYSYSVLLAMFNTALNTAWVDAGKPGGDPGGTFIAPYFYLDSDSQLISLVVNNTMVSNPVYKIGINDAALNYLQGFNLFFNQANPPGLPNDVFFFNLYSQGNTCNVNGGERRTVDLLDTEQYFFYEQEYQSLDLWSDLRKIYITTSTIPVKAEEKSVNLANGTQTGQTAYIPVLFDYTPIFNNSSSSRTISYYVPQSQYRLVDILGTEPISKISLDVYWQDTLGDAYPLYVQIYQAINIKIGFFKKSVYKNFYPNERNHSDRKSHRLGY